MSSSAQQPDWVPTDPETLQRLEDEMHARRPNPYYALRVSRINVWLTAWHMARARRMFSTPNSRFRGTTTLVVTRNLQKGKDGEYHPLPHPDQKELKDLRQRIQRTFGARGMTVEGYHLTRLEIGERDERFLMTLTVK